MNESGSGNINRIQTVPNPQPTWLKDLFSRLFWGLKPQWVEIRTGFLPANKTANRFPCQDHIERAKKNRYSHPAFLCAHCNHMHSTAFNAIIRVRFVSMPAYQPSSAWSGSRGGRQCRRFFGVCSPGWWCMFCSGARKDAGGGGALVYVVSIRALAFVPFLVLHLQITSTF